MAEQLYNTLLKITDISLIVMLLLSAYSLYVLIKRKNKTLVHVVNFFLYFAWGSGACAIYFLTMVVYVKQTHDGFDPQYANSQFFFWIFILIYIFISISVQWLWSHYSIEITEDRFVYHHFLLGKEEILYDDIDVALSKYSFVEAKWDIVRFSSCDMLHLVLKDGRDYMFKMEESLVGITPLNNLGPKVRALGIKFDVVDLKHQKLEVAYQPPEIEDPSQGKSKKGINDRINKRKKAEKAKKKAQKNKRR